MGVGLYLTGQYRSRVRKAESWLQRVDSWLEENAGEPFPDTRIGTDYNDRPALFLNLHPSSEDVEIIVPEPGTVIVSAKTSTTGPGYHIHLCELLHRLGEANGIGWDPPAGDGDTGDETGYFHTGDASAVDDEMLHWVKSVAGSVLEWIEKDGSNTHMISMPLNHRYSSKIGPILTPLGPRDRDWLETVLEDPHQGIDLFPWWQTGLTASYHLNRALCRMWTDVRWRPPLTDDEDETVDDVLTTLADAYRLEPSLSFPWREWWELIDHTNWSAESPGYDESIVDVVRRRAGRVRKSQPLVGFRRHPVHVSVAGSWSIEIPGVMAEEWDKEGTWSAWDGTRTIWVTAFRRARDDDSRVPAAEILADIKKLEKGQSFEWRKDHLLGKAVFRPYKEDGKKLWSLSAYSAVDGAFARFSAYVPDKKDRDWALATWHSLDHPDPNQEKAS